MKKVEAIIRHLKLGAVKKALDNIGVHGMNITEIRGAGKQRGYTETYRGTKVTIHLRPKIKLQTVVSDDQLDKVLEAIVKAAQTGEIGDGKIFVSPVEEAVRIRTGERGEKTL